jgi:hypothetical protein
LIKPATLLKFHKALVDGKYRLLFFFVFRRRPTFAETPQHRSRPAVLNRGAGAWFVRSSDLEHLMTGRKILLKRLAVTKLDPAVLKLVTNSIKKDFPQPPRKR